MNRIVIVGGGIGGLSAAYYATKKLADAQITLIESSNHWGGKICTDRVAFDDGQFIIEGGPDTFLATKPWGVALCKELGLSERLHGTNLNQKNTYVLHRNKLEPLPDGLSMMIPTNVPASLKSHLVSWLGKARMGLDFIQPAKNINGDESLGTFISRRLGREAYENLIEPLLLIGGLHGEVLIHALFHALHPTIAIRVEERVALLGCERVHLLPELIAILSFLCVCEILAKRLIGHLLQFGNGWVRAAEQAEEPGADE